MALAERGDRGACRLVDRIDPGNRHGPCRCAQRMQGSRKTRRIRQTGERDRQRRKRCRRRRALGHPDRHIDMHRAGLARQRQGNRLGHSRPHCPCRQPEAALGDRAQHRLMVEDLMGIGLGLCRIDAAGQKDQRHPVLHGIGHHVDRIRGPRPQRRHQHRQRAGHVPQPLGHEAARVFVFDQHELQPRRVKPLHHREHLAARNAEGVGGPRSGQRPPDDVCARRHARSPTIPCAISSPIASSVIPSTRARTARVSCPSTGGALA